MGRGIVPSLAPLAKLADYYGVSLDYLAGRTDGHKGTHWFTGRAIFVVFHCVTSFLSCQQKGGMNMVPAFQERLRACRKILQKTQPQAAQEAGIVYRTYQRYESGEAEPTLTPLIKLADYYGVSLDYLAGRTDKP